MPKIIGTCEYCMNKTAPYLTPEKDGIEAFVCSKCVKLLKDPVTALPLIRGNLTMKLRGEIPADKLSEMVNRLMVELSKFRPRNLKQGFRIH